MDKAIIGLRIKLLLQLFRGYFAVINKAIIAVSVPFHWVTDYSVLMQIKRHQKGERAGYVWINLGRIKMLNQDDASATSQWKVWTFRRKISSHWVNFCPVWREIDTLGHIMWEETFIWCHMNGKYHVRLRYLSFIFTALQATVNFPSRQRPTSQRQCRAADLTFRLPRRHAAIITAQMPQMHVIP